MKRRLSTMMMLGMFATAATAEPYWVAYEGNDYPENEGWTRTWNQPFAERWIDNGTFVIDATEDTSTCEWYNMYPDHVAPGQGETFILQWRVVIENFVGGWYGISAGVYSDDRWAVAFSMNNDTIRSVFETDVLTQYEPNVYHDYEMRSEDMRTYELYIDGVLKMNGRFWESLNSNKLGWGETTTGSACLSRWDYLRYGVVPEPAAAWGMVLAAGIVSRRNGR